MRRYLWRLEILSASFTYYQPRKDREMTDHITDNFYRHEFACKGQGCCGHSAPINMDLVYKLEMLREQIGPMTINSGFRCRKHNAAVGGSVNSQHTIGNAADIDLGTRDIWDVKQKAIELGFRGIGLYDTFIHLDVRNNHIALPLIWDKRS